MSTFTASWSHVRRCAIPALIPAVLALSACHGRASDDGSGGGGGADATSSGSDGSTTSSGVACDPAVRTFELPADLSAPPMMHLEVAPSDIDAATFAYPQSKHQVFLPDASAVTLRDELFVFLPGTNNLAQGFSTIAGLAARAGYPVVVLAYESDSHPQGLCSMVTDPQAHIDCRTGVWTEKAYGTDVTPNYPGDEPNSITGRLVRLLQHLDAKFPNAGAGKFLDGGAPRWDRIALAGFSQGSVLAGFIAKDHAVARLVVFAGGCDATGDSGTADRVLLPYCFEPRATPTARTWAISHVDDVTNADGLAHEALGLLALADYANASVESPSYCTNTHAIQSHEPTGKAHLSVALDDFVPLDGSGVPVLAEDYLYAFTAE